MGNTSRRILWVIAMFFSGLYLLNPGLGVFELLPDNLPLIGNLDEIGAVLLLLKALINLGVIKSRKIEKLIGQQERISGIRK